MQRGTLNGMDSAPEASAQPVRKKPARGPVPRAGYFTHHQPVLPGSGIVAAGAARKLEADAQVKGEAVICEPFWAEDGFFISDTEVHVVRQAGAEATTEGHLSHTTGTGASEVDHVLTFGVEPDGAAFRHHRPAIGSDEGNEPLADIVIDHGGVVEHGAKGTVQRDTEARIGHHVHIAKTFFSRYEQVQIAIAIALEDLIAAHWDAVGEAWGQDERLA